MNTCMKILIEIKVNIYEKEQLKLNVQVLQTLLIDQTEGLLTYHCYNIQMKQKYKKVSIFPKEKIFPNDWSICK